MTIIKIEKTIIEGLREQASHDGVQKIVAGAIIFRTGKALLLKRTKGEFMEGLVELPSGTIEAGEDILAGLIREVKEETGLETVSVDGYVNSFDYLSQSGRKTRQLNFFIQATGDVKINPSEHESFLWADPTGSEFQTMNLSEEVKESIRRTV
ncbi:MAG: NUDIX hydrolase [Patescibacteria group bacterium]